MLLRNGQTIKGFGGKALALSRDEKQEHSQGKKHNYKVDNNHLL